MSILGLFWSIILFASMIAFFGIAVIVSIKGVADIKSLFRHLSRDKERFTTETQRKTGKNIV